METLTKPTENLQEGWATFRRIHTKSGFIDVWTGDAAQNPNYSKRTYNLNSFATFIRLNGEKYWTNEGEFKERNVVSKINQFKDLFSAVEIWSFLGSFD